MDKTAETENKERIMSDPNENKPGYKKTKLGWIPEEWEVVKLNNIADINPSKSKIKNEEILVSFVGMADVSNEGKIINSTAKKFKEIKNGFTPFEDGDILIAKITPCFENGKGLLANNFINGKGFGSTEFHVVRVHEDISTEYIYYHTQSYRLRKTGERNMTGTAGQKRVPKDFIKNYKVPHPPLPEQQKIAQIFSTWDRAIDKTEKLIEKKQRLKKGLMQKLLSGKVRFPEFTEPWEEVKLGEIFSERVERGYNNLPLLAITDHNGVMYRDQLDKKDTSNPDKSKYKRICPGDIGYNTMRLWQGRSALSKLEGIVSPAYTIVTPNEKVDSLFMSYLFKLPKTIHLFYRYSQGLVSDTLNCKYKHFKLVHVQLPPNKEEQTKIANTLKTLDKEIDQLKIQNKLLQNQKKGLMQQLLTGKIRVKT